MRRSSVIVFALLILAILAVICPRCRAQATLLMEEPYGFFGSVNPTGHNAIYFERICAETPVKLRRCRAGEPGAVVSRYQGIGGYDWVAIPLVPYLYAVEDVSLVSAHVDPRSVRRLRSNYRENHLLSLGMDLSPGNFAHGGWAQLMGLSYERRIYGLRFETSEKQDDAFIALMNDKANRSHFSLLFNNCADFARRVLNFYFPGTFNRSVFPDAGMTTPKQIAYKLERYARKHPETQLRIFEISQVPGNRRQSHRNRSVAESLSTTGYAIPIAVVNPYLAGGLFVDYLVRGHHHLIPKNPQKLGPSNLMALTVGGRTAENPESAGAQVPGAAAGDMTETKTTAAANFGLTETKAEHEQILSAESQEPRKN